MRTLMFTYNGWEYPVHCHPHGDGWLGRAELPPNERGNPEWVSLWIPPAGSVQVTVLEGAREIEQAAMLVGAC